MFIKKYVFFLILCLVMAANAFSQAKDISEDKYYSSFRTASQKGRQRSRRSVQQIKAYQSGMLIEDEGYIEEYLLPDKKRSVQTFRDDGNTRKTEEIEIGGSYYCRKNDSEWVRSKNTCSMGGGGAGGPSDVRSSKYTVEEINIDKKKTKLYTSYVTYKNTFSPRSDKESLYYLENKFWLNSEGFVIREELKRGLLSPERLDEQESRPMNTIRI